MTPSRIYRLVPFIVIALAAAVGLAGAVRPAAAAYGPPDLQVSVTGSPNPVFGNGADPTLTYTLKVYNTPEERCELYRGEDRCINYGRNVSGVVVDLAVPAGSTYQSYVADHGFNCAAQSATLVRCLNGSLLMYDEAKITIKLWAPKTSGPITATATVDPANAIAERNETNNTASATVSAVLVTDVDITGFTATPNPASPYDTVTLSLTISNVSNVAANGVRVYLQNKPTNGMQLHFVSGGGADGWTCVQASSTYFSAYCGKGSNFWSGSIPAGGSLTLTITATTAGPATIDIEANLYVEPYFGTKDVDFTNTRYLKLTVQ